MAGNLESDQKDKIKAFNAAYHAAHRAEILERKRAAYRANLNEKREAARKRMVEARARNPEKYREISNRAGKKRRAAKAIAEGRLPGRVGNQKHQTPEERATYLKIWRLKNLDKVRARDAAKRREQRRLKAEAEGREIKIGAIRRLSDEERRDHARLNSRSYRKKYPDHAKKIDREYYENNKESVSARTRRNLLRFKEENPEEFRRRPSASDRNRRAQKKGNGGKHTAADIAYLFKLQKGKCVLCLKPLIKTKFHVDHHTPLSKGGSNDRSNLRLLHNKCNLSKGARDPAEHALRNGLLCW